MKFLMLAILALFTSPAFASGDFFVMPTQSFEQGKTYGSFGLDVNQPVKGKFNYRSWTALGNDVIYAPQSDQKETWFGTRQGISYEQTKYRIEGGYSLRYIEGLPGLLNRDNGVYVKATYHAW